MTQNWTKLIQLQGNLFRAKEAFADTVARFCAGSASVTAKDVQNAAGLVVDIAFELTETQGN